jgi:hypothetical protein
MPIGDVAQWRSNHWFKKLEPVPRRIKSIEAPHAREIIIPFHFDVVRDQPISKGIKVRDEDARVSFRGGPEILLHPKMDLQ